MEGGAQGNSTRAGGGRRASRDLMRGAKLLVPRKGGSAAGRVICLVDGAAGGALLAREPCNRALVACAHGDGAAGLT